MKKITWIILILSFLSCKQNKLITHSANNDDFYSALNELIKSEFPNVKMIVDKTMPVYRNMYGNYPEPETKEIEPPPPPPPPPGIVYYDRTTFKYFAFEYQLDSSDAKFMYQSIDSTRIILIDPRKVNLKVIEHKTMQEIFGQKTELFSDRWKKFRETFGEGCFIETSTPIYNSDSTKLLLTIKKLCGPPDGEDSIYILEKINNKWRIVESNYDITTEPG
jgi:hypothetical protein